MALSSVDHGLDREGHALFKHLSFARGAVVQDLRFLVEDPPDAVPAVFPDH